MQVAIIVFFAILIISFYIAKSARKRIEANGKVGDLFFGNNEVLAISSNVGSIFSLTLICSLVALTFKMELNAVLVFLFATGVALLLLYFAINKIENDSLKYNYKNGFRTSLEYFYVMLGAKSSLLMGWLYILLYAVSMAVELSVFNFLVKEYLVDDFLMARILTFMLISVCLMYVYIGSYFGVLMTDKFQLLIIALSVLLINSVLIDCSGLMGLDVYGSRFNGFDGFSRLCYVPGNVINTVFQIVVLVFAMSMWFIALPDFWIRNIGFFSEKKVKLRVVTKTVFLLLPFAVGVISFGFYMRVIFGWPSEADAPFYSIVNFIGVLISDGSRLSSSESAFFSVIDGTLNQALLILSTFSLFVVILLTTMDTFLITIAQMRNVMHSFNRRNVSLKVPDAEFIFIVGAFTSLLTIFMQDRVFTGWGTFAASLFLFLSSIMLTTLFMGHQKEPKKIFIAMVISLFVFFVSVGWGWIYSYNAYISMHSVLCALYIIPYPLIILFLPKKQTI